jgi:hypothetical protein
MASMEVYKDSRGRERRYGPHGVGRRGNTRHLNLHGYYVVNPDPTDEIAIAMSWISDRKNRTTPVRRALEHRLVMARHIGRALLPSESVHHINGIKIDNRIENLQLMHSQPYGQHWRCLDCGSQNVEAMLIDTP